MGSVNSRWGGPVPYLDARSTGQGGDPSSKRFHLNHLELTQVLLSIGEIAGQRSWGHYAASVVLRFLSFGPTALEWNNGYIYTIFGWSLAAPPQ
eukprot:3695342-Prymnesium_polylepis.1